MFARLTMIASGATQAARKGRFPTDEAPEPSALDRAGAIASSLRRADRVWT
ncbi:MAG: histidine phosphatase family protein, partial [Mesorhizobium sp.]